MWEDPLWSLWPLQSPAPTCTADVSLSPAGALVKSCGTRRPGEAWSLGCWGDMRGPPPKKWKTSCSKRERERETFQPILQIHPFKSCKLDQICHILSPMLLCNIQNSVGESEDAPPKSFGQITSNTSHKMNHVPSLTGIHSWSKVYDSLRTSTCTSPEHSE